MKKLFSTLLAVAVLVCSMLPLTVSAADAVVYTETFQHQADVNYVSQFLAMKEWCLESTDVSQGSYPGTEPAVKGGKVILSRGDSVMFDWTAIDGIGAYNSAKTYTMEFDFNITEDGDGAAAGIGQNREFYFAPGGYFNQIEAKDGKLRVGGTGAANEKVNYSFDTQYHAKVEWLGQKITSTVTNSTGAVLRSDSRTSASYTDMTANKEAMRRWAFRCEDGEVEIDNFSFTDGTTSFADDFEFGVTCAENMLKKDYWNIECEDYTYGVGKTFNSPEVKNGALYLQEAESVAFTWTKIPGMGAFDTSKTYTFEFDVTVTSDGDDGNCMGNASWIREFFVAPGGWFNQIEFKDGKLRAGGDGTVLNNYSIGTQYHAKIEWKNQSVTSTITDIAGNVIGSGTRTGAQYSSMTANEGIMNHWVFRCEDGESVMDNFSFTDGTTTFTDSFDYTPEMDALEALLASDIWDLESADLPGDVNGNAPAIENDKMILSKGDSVAFHWTAISGMPTFDTSTTYTFEFDVEMLTYEGDSGWVQSRELYFAPGGYFNQLEFLNGSVRTGYNTYVPFDATKPVHVKAVWRGDSITTTAYDTDGKIINSGTRTNSAYADMSENSKAMQYWVFRCEDGEIAISDLTFTANSQTTETKDFAVNSSKKHVVYEADVTVADGETASLSFNGGELITFADGGMKIVGTVAGSYPAGTYNVKADLNFAQQNVLITVTLPDGGILRRGDSAMLGSATSASKITFTKTGACAIANETVSYPNTTARSYTFPSAPSKTTFETKAYNLTSSFDGDAKTTRSFAWTAVKDFDNMAVVYAKADEFGESSKRMTVNGVKETPEEAANQSVIYYKADIKGLEAGTSYTYMIGDITDNEWGSAYTFTTEGENETDFSFIAIADTQSTSWDGYKYAKVALDMALSEAPDAKFLLHGGDVVEQGAKDSMWNAFFDVMKGTTETLPMFATIGNHDTWDVSGTEKTYGDLLFDLHFNHPNNGGAAALGGKTPDHFSTAAVKNVVKNADETIYSFDYGNVHVVVLNSGSFISLPEDNALLEAQKAWLENDLANSDATWTVGLVHQGVYHRYNTAWYCNALQEVLEDNGVDVIFNGHEHIVKRTYQMKDAEIVSKKTPDTLIKGEGTVYSTLGSTNTSHDKLANSVEEALMINGLPNTQATYTVVNVTEDDLTVTIKTLNGLVVDSFTVVNDCMKLDDVTVGNASATVSALTKDTTATVHFNYRSETANEQPYIIMAAYYSGKELIASQKIASGTATVSYDYKCEFVVPDVENVTAVKFFAWNTETGALPLVKALEIK